MNIHADQQLKTDLVFEGMGFRIEDPPELASKILTPPSGSPKSVKADFIFEIFLFHLRKEPAAGELISGLVKCVYHWIILKKGKTASEWTTDLKCAKGDIYNEAPRAGAIADVRITIDDDDLILMLLGKLNPQRAYMQGRLKIGGNIMLTQKFNTLWQEICKSGRVPELQLMEPLLSDTQPLSDELWSDYQFFVIAQRLAHLPQLSRTSSTAYHFVVTKEGVLRSEWTVDLSRPPGAVHRGAPRDVAPVCKIKLDDIAFYYLVQGAQSAEQTFARAEVSHRGTLDAVAPLFITKSKF